MPAFENLPVNALVRLERGASPMEPGNGDEIFPQGSPADAVYAIVGGEGRVRIGAIDRHSKRLMVEVFGVGEIFGEVGVIDTGTRTAAAVADGRVRLLRIGASTFMSVLNETPALGANLARILARRLRRTFLLFQDATFETLEVRLARQLLYLAALQGRRTEEGVVLASRLKQPDLADLLGATTRSIITILNSWRADGIVRYNSERAQLTISNKARLKALTEPED
jgi:CRP/FNR family transcriptional regulator, cyclic AMP receptor protein